MVMIIANAVFWRFGRIVGEEEVVREGDNDGDNDGLVLVLGVSVGFVVHPKNSWLSFRENNFLYPSRLI